MAEKSSVGTFIPHDTVAGGRGTRRQRSSAGLNDLLLLIAIVLLVASGALAVGVFLYGQYLKTESSSKLDQLQRAESAFEPSLIQQLTRLDDRMHAGETVLGAHLAPTVFFAALEQATLQTVSFNSLQYEAPDPQHITVKMQGVAESVNSIALEADILSKSGIVVNPVFSNITRQADGVHFDLSASLNPQSMRYATMLSQSPQSAAPASASQSPASIAPAAGAGTTTSSQAQPQGAPSPFEPSAAPADNTSTQ